jgi:hypothetical protein
MPPARSAPYVRNTVGGKRGHGVLALMGHMSRAMLERYSHVRMAAKRDAVAGVTFGGRLKFRGSPCESPCTGAGRPCPVVFGD